MIVLGVDWGRARAGVAVSDELGLLAHPVGQFRADSPAALLLELEHLAQKYRAEEVVMGLPLNMDGSEGDSAAAVRRFAEELGRRLNRPVTLQDERLTTWEAEKFLTAERGLSREKRKKVKDQMAACLILQAYLDIRKKS